MAYILPPLPPLFLSLCVAYPLNKISYATDFYLLVQTLKLIPLTSYKLHYLCIILYQSPPLIICRGGGEKL